MAKFNHLRKHYGEQPALQIMTDYIIKHVTNTNNNSPCANCGSKKRRSTRAKSPS
jgi:hypothetical protein